MFYFVKILLMPYFSKLYLPSCTLSSSLTSSPNNNLTGQLNVILQSPHTERLWLIIPALAVWVLSCWQTVFLCHLAYLFIHLTFTVAEADGLSLGYKFLTPQGFAASITPICLAELVSVRLFNQWHMNTIKVEVLKAKSLFNKSICMCLCTRV